MDATSALHDLTEISSQVDRAVIVDSGGSVLGSTFDVEERARRFADLARKLVEEADSVREGRGLPSLGQLEAATVGGSVFVVRDGDRLLAATTKPEPTVGLVFYDLKQCLRSVEAEPATKSPVRASGPVEGAPGEPGGSPAPKARTRKKKADAAS
jgi:predicted regulator of Ras-like GTPase activity (Roadblock/LC7/MglB family)